MDKTTHLGLPTGPLWTVPHIINYWAINNFTNTQLSLCRVRLNFLTSSVSDLMVWTVFTQPEGRFESELPACHGREANSPRSPFISPLPRDISKWVCTQVVDHANLPFLQKDTSPPRVVADQKEESPLPTHEMPGGRNQGNNQDVDQESPWGLHELWRLDTGQKVRVENLTKQAFQFRASPRCHLIRFWSLMLNNSCKWQRNLRDRKIRK